MIGRGYVVIYASLTPGREGGEVWKATKVGGTQSLAIKKVLLQFKTLSATSREIATMSKIKHHNTLKYYNCYKHENSIWVCFAKNLANGRFRLLWNFVILVVYRTSYSRKDVVSMNNLL